MNNNIDARFLNKRYLIIIILALFWISCEEDSDVTYSESKAIDQVVLNPYLQVTTGFVSFKPGTPKYGIGFNVVNGVKEVEKINVYSTFKDQGTGEFSNEVLVATYDVESPQRTVVIDSLTYDELKTGMIVNGGPLPASDEDVVPGSGWTFRFEGVKPSGETVDLKGAINMVFSKYAGLYDVKSSTYWRIGVLRPETWVGEERFIGHIDDVTLSHPDAWGPFTDWTGNEFHLTVNPDTKKITIVLTEDGLYSGQRLVTCATDKKLFEAVGVACDDYNVLIEDEATGKHVIKLAYGYFTETGAVGPRVFIETLEKKVD